MLAVLSGSDRDNPRPTTSSAREGHGQHLQIRSLVSNPDDRHADHLGLDATLRPVEPPGDDRRVNALMVFKAVRGSQSPRLLPALWRPGMTRQPKTIPCISRTSLPGETSRDRP
jgi:hypothetical protein